VSANPGYAPELLALAAVETMGPDANEWVRQVRATYPSASDEGIARLAVQRFTRMAAAGGAAAAATGLLAPVTELAALAWTQAALVLHLAAAFRQDASDPERAVDLLVLTRMHPSPETARAALATAVDQSDDSPYSVGRATEAAWRLTAPLVTQTAGWLVLRLASRLVPGVALVVASAGDAAAATRLAHRAISHYRGR
jgi:hypothetical protein